MTKKLTVLLLLVTMMFGIFGLVGCDNISLADYKATKSQSLQDYANSKGEENYCETGWKEICKAVADGKAVIEDATTKSTVEKAYNDAKVIIDSVERKEENIGKFYTLQEAYDESMLTVDDLLSIAHYQSGGEDYPDFIPLPKNPENLNNVTINAIKKTYLVNLRKAKNQDGVLIFPNATMNDVKFLGYYGSYNNAIAVKISDEFSGYPGVVQQLTVSGIIFTYSGVPVSIWQSFEQ